VNKAGLVDLMVITDCYCCSLTICWMISEKHWVLVVDLLTFRWLWADGPKSHAFLMVTQHMTTVLVRCLSFPSITGRKLYTVLLNFCALFYFPSLFSCRPEIIKYTKRPIVILPLRNFLLTRVLFSSCIVSALVTVIILVCKWY